MYHISDLKDFNKCPRFYYLNTDKNNFFNAFLRADDSITELLCQKLNISNVFHGKRNDDVSLFLKNKDNYEAFEYVRLQDEDLRVTVPLMVKKGNAYDVYYVYYNTSIKVFNSLSYSISVNVIKKYVKVKEVYFVHPNADYIFHKKIDPSKALVITNMVDGKRLLNLLNEKEYDYKKIIKEIKTNNIDNYVPIKSHICKAKNMCPHYYKCFKEEIDIPDDSIHYLVSSQFKEKMALNGVVHVKDADYNLLEGNRIQYAQVMASRNGGLFVDKYNLKNWMKCLNNFPITFIDFEWDRYLIPKYEGMKALDVMPFEYVLYTISKKGKLSNKCFVGNLDSRKDFIKSLLHSIPKKGPIVAYNAYNAEVQRLKELAEVFPKYKEKIYSLCDRFVDLAEPFIEGLIYDNKMHGNFTLKKLTEVVSDKSYSEFEISNGLEAIQQFRQLDQGKVDDSKKIVDDLKEYCGLDAFALYLVYKYLMKKID